jgi:uncharacterized YccA/Bax inhibitor family protein
MEKILLILQMSSTLVMFGVIWIIQLVQYPFFSYVDPENFPKYHAAHTFWITPVVAPTMIIELITSILIIFYPPKLVDPTFLYFGLILTLIVWASTFFIQIPLHNKLAGGFDARAHRKLVNTNWIRTIAWSLRAGLVVYLVWIYIEV